MKNFLTFTIAAEDPCL